MISVVDSLVSVCLVRTYRTFAPSYSKKAAAEKAESLNTASTTDVIRTDKIKRTEMGDGYMHVVSLIVYIGSCMPLPPITFRARLRTLMNSLMRVVVDTQRQGSQAVKMMQTEGDGIIWEGDKRRWVTMATARSSMKTDETMVDSSRIKNK